MDILSSQEKVNLKTFSNLEAVGKLYNKEGFTDKENYIIKKYFDKKGRVLDIGCGTGRTTYPFHQRGFTVTGIDLSQEMIDCARKKYAHINFSAMNACALDFEDESFDYVFFSFNGIDCIHPFSKRLESLTQVYRVLKKGGIFAYSSHNALALPRTREALQHFLGNVLNLKIFGRYRLEVSSTGKLYLYYGNPFSEKKILDNAGFQTLEIVGGKFKNGFSKIFLDLAPYYVTKK